MKNTALVFDTETTGLPLFKEPSEHPDQPHLVQLGAMLVDIDTRKPVSRLDVVIRPDGWVIPDEVAAIHGITAEMAMDLGVSESLAVGMLMDLWRDHDPRMRVAHNEQFDARIIRIALMRYEGEELADAWKAGPAMCTAKLATPIMQMPPTEKMVRAGFNKHKTPNLGEAYRYFTGRELEGAHSAMVDVRACAEVFFAIQDLQGGSKAREAA
jgi:DNA polymerase-3 subunit epsilon